MLRVRATSWVLSLACAGGVWLAAAAPAAAVPEAERLYTVGDRAFQDGLPQLSVRVLTRFLDRYPSDPRAAEATLTLGKARFALKAFQGALEAFTRAASFASPPGRPGEAAFWEAETLFRLKRWEDARAAYQRIASGPTESPYTADALYGLAWASLETGRPEQAVVQFRRLAEGYPDHASAPSAAFQLGRVLLSLKRPLEAAPVLRGFTERHPGHQFTVEARYLYGQALLEAGDEREGAEALRAFLAANPSHELAPQAQRALTSGLIRRGDKSDMAEEYKRLTAIRPATAETLYDAGAIALRLKRTREAEAAWARVRREFPDDPLAARAALELAQGAFGREQWKEAASLAVAAAKGTEGAVRAEAHLLHGESELKLRRFGSAHQAFQAAVATPGVDPQVRYRALAGSGLAMEEQQQWAQAARYYEEVAARSPDRSLKSWARERRAAVDARLAKPSRSQAGPQPRTRSTRP